ncbi:MAG: PorT family protein [Bacteroidales bacterium]|nr:PorT family protein [Bacteroidales bacterium]
MKNKIFSIAIILMLTASMAIAQRPGGQRTAFGVLGGVNLQNINGKDFSGDKLENDMIIGYHAGLNIQIPIASEFYFQPGVLFSTKGAKIVNDPIQRTINLSYIEVPLNLVYKGLLGNGYVMVGFGPYVGYAFKGTDKFEAGSISYENDIEFVNVVDATDDLLGSYSKALDAGANIFAGYELAGGLFFQLNTQLGLLKINPEDNRFPGDNKREYRNTGYGVSLGYRF